MIAAGLKIGIGKRELLEDYYLDELPLIFEQYNVLSGAEGAGGTAEEAFADDIW